MAKENEIARWINECIQEVLSEQRFAGSQYSGITSLLMNDQESTALLMPCTIDSDGEGLWVGVDDAYPVQLYHRHNGCVFKSEPADAFGGNAPRKEFIAMSLFVVAQRSRTRLAPEDLKTLIATAFPYEIPAQKRALWKLSGSISLLSADLNSQNVYKREYNPAPTILDPQVNMFELKYQIECSYQKDCINTLCC